MGNSLNKNTSYSDILFNEKICGENISISEDRTCAKRIRSFCKGICYANRPVDINEIICLKILETSENWAGGLKIGFTTQDIVHKYSKWKNSSHLSQRKKVSTYITPKYSCPNFQTSCWIKPIPLPYIQTNNYICLFINPNGRISLAINGQLKDTLITNLPVNMGKNGELSSKLWPMFDLYGNTVAIKLIPFCEFQLIFNSNMFGFSKGLTDYSRKQSKSIESSMVDDLPNSTPPFNRNADIIHDPYKAFIRAHKLHQYKFVASEPLSIHYRHAYDSAHPTQFIALPFHSLGRGRNVSIAFHETTPALTIMSNSTQNALNHDFMIQNSHDDENDNDEITCPEGNGPEESRLFRILNSLSAANALNHHSSFKSASSQSKKKCLTSSDQNNDILYQFTQAIRRPHEFCNAYVFTSRPIGTNEKVIIRIDSIDPTYVGTLGLGYTSCNPTTLHGQKLPDDSTSLMDRDEYWVVLKDLIPNSATNSLDTGDEIAMYYDNNGQIIVEMNGTMIGSDYYIDPSQELWAFWDLYGCVEKITILGSYHVILDLMQLHLQKQQRNETNDQENDNVESSNSNQIISLINERNHNNYMDSQQNRTQINGAIRETFAIESSNIGSNDRALPIIRNQINPNNQGHTYYSIDLTTNKHHNQTNNNVDSKVITNLNKNIQSDDLSFLIPSQIYELSPPTENGASPSCVKSLLNNQITALNSNYVNGSFNLVNGLENMASSKNKKPPPTPLSTNTVSTLSLNSTHSSCTSSERERFDQYNANTYHLTKQAAHNAKSNASTGTHYINLGKNGDYDTLKQKTQHNFALNISKEKTELSTLSSTNDSININDRECIVCYENDINIMLYPCGHACMCNACAQISWKAFQTAKIAKLNDGALNDENNSQNYLTDSTITQHINQLSFEDSFDPDRENNNSSIPKDCLTNEKSTILGLCPICREPVKDVVKLYIP